MCVCMYTFVCGGGGGGGVVVVVPLFIVHLFSPLFQPAKMVASLH